MSWIKRNLYFVIGAAVALVLIGLAGWYLFSKWQLNSDNLAKLNGDYQQLGDLNKQNPHPGNEKINNVSIAQEQQKQLLAFKEKTRKQFVRISPIPDVSPLTSENFSTALSRTISQLQRDATNASVVLPGDYAFSFGSQNGKLSFAPNSLESLSMQLGEVKAVCDILFQAKINALEAIRRERASADDATSTSAGDYLSDKSVTNAQAVLSPYEVTFRCFSQELAAVLAGFARSSNGVVIKAINVETAPASVQEATPTPAAMAQPVNTAYNQALAAAQAAASEEARRQAEAAAARDAYNRRYGGGNRRGPAVPMQQAVVPQPVVPTPGPAKTVLTTVLDEKQLKVVLMLNVVKLLETKQAAPK